MYCRFGRLWYDEPNVVSNADMTDAIERQLVRYASAIWPTIYALDLLGAGGRTKVQLCVSPCADENTRQIGITSHKLSGELGGIVRCESPTYQVETKQLGSKNERQITCSQFCGSDRICNW